jgi:hypothetical protein
VPGFLLPFLIFQKRKRIEGDMNLMLLLMQTAQTQAPFVYFYAIFHSRCRNPRRFGFPTRRKQEMI